MPQSRHPLPLATLSAAVQAAAIDLATDQRTNRAAEDRTKGAIAAAGDLVAGQRTDARTDDQASSAVVAAAIVTPVAPAPHVAVPGDPAGLIIAAAIIIDAPGVPSCIPASFASLIPPGISPCFATFIAPLGLTRPFLGPLAMRRGPARRIGSRRRRSPDAGDAQYPCRQCE